MTACSVAITAELDVFEARRRARELALELGFSKVAAAEVCIAVSELATNILKHGIRGAIELDRIGDSSGLSIVARDQGPPIRNLSMAVADGCDDEGPLDPARLPGRTGMGGGLGAVLRFTDSFTCIPEAKGKSIVVVRYRERKAKRRALIVEDDLDIGQCLVDLFELAGCEVVLCTDGRAALDAALREPVDFVVLDWCQPEPPSGSALLRLLLPIARAPVIAISADPSVGPEALADGAACFVQKPYRNQELLAAVCEWVRSPGMER